jgi:hypothetical protein
LRLISPPKKADTHHSREKNAVDEQPSNVSSNWEREKEKQVCNQQNSIRWEIESVKRSGDAKESSVEEEKRVCDRKEDEKG